MLDKTGTLTQGRPTVRHLEALDGDADERLTLAAAAENHSEHPLARAVVAAAQQQDLAVPEVEDFESVTGSGVPAQVNGRQVLIGRPGLLTGVGINLSAVRLRIDQLEAAGHTVIIVAAEAAPVGVIALGDELRPDTVDAVAAMRRAGMDPILVTGDNERAARRIVQAAGHRADLRRGATGGQGRQRANCRPMEPGWRWSGMASTTPPP